MILILNFLTPATSHGEYNNYWQESKEVQTDSSKQLWLYWENNTLTVSTKNLHDRIETSPKDNGSVIPEDIKDQIFQSIFTFKSPIEELFLAYEVIKEYGGELKLQPGTGE